jgi:hypothetical protein
MEELTVAADPDPYFALPKLYGGPAYARPPRVVQEAERPFDPDDLPIAAARTADAPEFAGVAFSSASYHSIGSESLLAAVLPAAVSPAAVSPAAAVGVAAVAASAVADLAPPAARDPAPSATSCTTPPVGAPRFSLRTLTDRLGPRSK